MWCEIWTDLSCVLSQSTCSTERQTDRQTEFSSLDGVCIPCIAVKKHSTEDSLKSHKTVLIWEKAPMIRLNHFAWWLRFQTQSCVQGFKTKFLWVTVLQGWNFPFLVDLCMNLTAVQHYCAACDVNAIIRYGMNAIITNGETSDRTGTAAVIHEFILVSLHSWILGVTSANGVCQSSRHEITILCMLCRFR